MYFLNGGIFLNNSIIEVIKKRRSIRKFKRNKIDKKILLELLKAGIWAPSGSNVQPWYFFIINDEDLINKIKYFSPGLSNIPPDLIVLAVDKELAYKKGGLLGRDVLSLMDISMAAQNIMLLATEKNIGTCPVKSFNKKAIEKLLRIPENIDIELLIALGYPAKIPSPPERKKLEDISYFNMGQGINDE